MSEFQVAAAATARSDRVLVQSAVGRQTTVGVEKNSRLDQVARVSWCRGRRHIESQRRHLVGDLL